jgi:hypothetical protein
MSIPARYVSMFLMACGSVGETYSTYVIAISIHDIIQELQ